MSSRLPLPMFRFARGSTRRASLGTTPVKVPYVVVFFQESPATLIFCYTAEFPARHVLGLTCSQPPSDSYVITLGSWSWTRSRQKIPFGVGESRDSRDEKQAPWEMNLLSRLAAFQKGTQNLLFPETSGKWLLTYGSPLYLDKSGWYDVLNEWDNQPWGYDDKIEDEMGFKVHLSSTGLGLWF